MAWDEKLWKDLESSSTTMKLHVLPVSANSHGCIALIRHCKADIEIIDAMGKTRSEEFLKINPCHVCPTLEFDGDDAGAIWESNAILRYLAVNLPGGEELYPADPRMRGKIDMAMDWRQTGTYACISKNIGYCVFGQFGIKVSEEGAKEDFATLLTEHFPVLTDVYLKETKFCFSDTPTIADLAIAPALTFLKARKNFWAKVPEAVKDYHARVLEAFPDTKEYFDMLDGMCAGYDGEGADAEP
mmetsp:Transcript_17294/g.41513  ORF Transcript_17294/g.41513 Transcript_17294/m.41513 type:complete len:243 (-) Transcript_17294:168-896(-)